MGRKTYCKLPRIASLPSATSTMRDTGKGRHRPTEPTRAYRTPHHEQKRADNLYMAVRGYKKKRHTAQSSTSLSLFYEYDRRPFMALRSSSSL